MNTALSDPAEHGYARPAPGLVRLPAAQRPMHGPVNLRTLPNDVDTSNPYSGCIERRAGLKTCAHVRHYPFLQQRIAAGLRRSGALFANLFAHRAPLHPFGTAGTNNWLSRFLLTGGLLPADDSQRYFQADLALERPSLLNGTRARRRVNHWLARHDARPAVVLTMLREAYRARARLCFERWRISCAAYAALLGYAGADAWLIAHCCCARPVTGAKS